MKILFLGMDYVGHRAPCKIFLDALKIAKHEVVYTKYYYENSEPTDLATWMARGQDKTDEQIKLYAPLIKTGTFDLMISELPIFAAAILKETYDIPWAVFNALPLFCIIKGADLFLQASIPEFERCKNYENVRYVGPFVNTSGTPIHKSRKPKPVIHVTQGTVANKDQILIETTKKATQGEWILVSESLPHHIWMPSFDVFITNGGFGGVSLAIYHGIPIIVAGETEEKPIVGQKVAQAGIGIDLGTASPSILQIRAAIYACLHNPQIQANCTRLSRIAKQYEPVMAVDYIEDLMISKENIQCRA